LGDSWKGCLLRCRPIFRVQVLGEVGVQLLEEVRPVGAAQAMQLLGVGEVVQRFAS